MGRMRSAIYKDQEMDVRELVKNQKIWVINGIADMPETPLFRVERGTAVSLDIANDNSWPHAMYLHCHMVEHMAGGMVTWFEVT